MQYAKVILPIATPKLYTYSLPEQWADKARVGQRVVVQVRKKLYTGIIAELTDQKPEFEVKPILEILDPEPFISPTYLEFWQWTAEYYMCTVGEVLVAALPSALRLEGEQQVFPNKTSTQGIILDQIESQILELVWRKPYTINQLRSKLGISNPLKYVKSLVEKGLVRVDQVVENPFKPKMEKFIRLNSKYSSQQALNQVFDQLKRARKQTDLLLAYLTLTKLQYDRTPALVPQADLLKQVDSPSALKSLIEKGIFEQVEKPVLRFGTQLKNIEQINPLTPAQQQAFDQINTLFSQKNVVLLFGITASGKTEIYMHLIKQVIEQGGQVLYLLPEIAITTQIIYRLQAVFGSKVGIYHSKLSESERAEVWYRTSGKWQNFEPYSIIIGVRSAIFLPFNNLRLIIVDEEHENTYKQFEPAPRYNARDLAIVLGKITGAKVLLGTATPSLESYYNALQGKYGLVELNVRYKDILPPEIILADTRLGYKQRLMHGIFHKILLENIAQVLQQGGQVILFRNRRGFAPYIECQDCGWVPKCKYCDVSLTYHKDTNSLVCHYCGYTIKTPTVCPHCGSFRLKLKSFGTERIEEELKIFFPDAQIERLDLDTTKAKNAHADIIERFEQGKIHILVGTQMVTKGLDFQNVYLVGILNADSLLNYPDFRSYERAFQLMVQVSGRAGRKNRQGRVIIQTAHPEHPVFKYVIENNYKGFFHWQLKERKDFSYPPFTRLIKIIVKDKDQERVDFFAQLLADQLRQTLKHRVLGPEYPVVKRVQNWFRKEILIKLEHGINLKRAKTFIYETAMKLKHQQKFYKLYVLFDVDPM